MAALRRFLGGFLPRCAAFAALSGCALAGGAQETAPADASSGADVGPMPTPDSDAGTGPSLGDASVDVKIKGETVLYAHTNATLFRLDPEDPLLASTAVGDFDCLGGPGAQSMTDLAVDRDGKLYGISQKRIFLDMKIGAGVVECATRGVDLLTPGAFFGGSFAPVGTLSPGKESLIVANSEGKIFDVDLTNGTLTEVGNFGKVPPNDGRGHNYPTKHVGTAWELSGDIVFAENQGAPVGFATLRDCPNPPSTTGCSRVDTLVEIDVRRLSKTNPTNVVRQVRGQVVKSAQCGDSQNDAYGSVYGIAAFGGDIFGFSRTRVSDTGPLSSLVVRIKNVDGTACLLADRTGDAAGGWAGAGVTTIVPVIAPPR